jgi:hypothetical protein
VASRCSPGLIERLFDLPPFERRECPQLLTSAIGALIGGSPCLDWEAKGEGAAARSPLPPSSHCSVVPHAPNWEAKGEGARCAPHLRRGRTGWSARRSVGSGRPLRGHPPPSHLWSAHSRTWRFRGLGFARLAWFSIHESWCARLMLARRRRLGRGAWHACSGVKFLGLWNERLLLVASRCSPGLIERLFDLPPFERRGCPQLLTSGIGALIGGSSCHDWEAKGEGARCAPHLRRGRTGWSSRRSVGSGRPLRGHPPPSHLWLAHSRTWSFRGLGFARLAWFSIHESWYARLMLARRRKLGRGACHACSGVRFHGLWNESHVLVASRCSPGLIERLFDLPPFERRGCPRSGRPEPTCARMDARACLRRRWGAQRAPSSFAYQAGDQGPHA